MGNIDEQLPVVIITGTSRGLGSYLRAELSEKKYVVYGSSRRGGNDGKTLKLDVTQAPECERAVQEVVQREGKIDVLINNVGSHLYGAAIETNDAELDAQMQSNFFGAVNMTRCVLPHMLSKGRGRIINISSVGGRFAIPFTSAYSASKFALEGYMESLRLELLPLGIFVCNLEPSFLKTGTTQLSVQMVSGGHSSFAGPRKAAHDRAVAAGDSGLPLDRVSRAVERIIAAKRPRFRISVDGFATKLGIMRFLTPEMIFERIVIRQTSPEMLEATDRASH